MSNSTTRHRSFVPWVVWLTLYVTAAAGLAFALAWLDPSEFGIDVTLSWCWLVFGLLWLLLTAVPTRSLLMESEWRPARAWLSSIVVLLVAIGARVPMVLLTEPYLSDDIWRYQFDGPVLANGINPYAKSPNQTPHPQIFYAVDLSRPDLVTVYQPASQWTFAALYLASIDTPSWSADAVDVFRLGFVSFDAVVIVLLLTVVWMYRRSPWLVALYAWHPLVITEVAASGHQDVVGIALLLAALALWDRLVVSQDIAGGPAGRPLREGDGGAAMFARPGVRVLAAALAGVTFAGAVGVKPVVLPIALFGVYFLRGDRRSLVISVVAAVVTGVALYLPFVLMPGGIGRMLETAAIFTRDWAFNSSVHGPMHSLFESDAVQGLLGGGTLARGVTSKWFVNAIIWSALVYVMVRTVRAGCDLWQTVLVYLFALLLLSSTCHPWYLLWALAILPIRFNAAVWVWSLTISWSYVALVNAEGFHVPPWVLAAEYAPVYGVLIWLWWRTRSRDSEAHGL